MPAPATNLAMDDAHSTDNPDFKYDVIACNVAESFTNAYYNALQKDRITIPLFYLQNEPLDDKKSPSIVWNGELFPNPIALQAHFEGLTHTYFDAEDLDCTVLNLKYLPASAVKNGSGDESKDLERRMSITVVVMGSVRLEEQLKGPIRVFSESFVLVPNSEKLTNKNINLDKGWQYEWLIQSQNFRFTEWSVNEVEQDGAKAPAVAGKAKVDGAGPKVAFSNTSTKGIAGQFAAAGLFFKKPGTAM